jgi:hypothetical protein
MIEVKLRVKLTSKYSIKTWGHMKDNIHVTLETYRVDKNITSSMR